MHFSCDGCSIELGSHFYFILYVDCFDADCLLDCCFSRWRLILLSPEEEEDISSQLAGSGWYHAIGEILSRDGPITIIPPSDWRHAWVTDTLHRLENVIPLLGNERALEQQWLQRGADDVPLPPPADYPLKPRPRASEMLHLFCQNATAREPVPEPPSHNIPGPPYSLVLIDNPDSNNAFSYGFGPDGAGGIVVFSGFLNQIFEKYPLEPVASEQPSSWWTSVFGGFFSSPSVVHYRPTPEQTSDLAVLLAHELSHLVLSHHLETLSSRTIVIPGILSILSDLVRTLTFPLTMLFGPFVNDAVAQMGKVGSGQLGVIHENYTTMMQEIEADVVSARLVVLSTVSSKILSAHTISISSFVPTGFSHMRVLTLVEPSTSGKKGQTIRTANARLLARPQPRKSRRKKAGPWS